MKQISFSPCRICRQEPGDAARAVSLRDGEGGPLARSPVGDRAPLVEGCTGSVAGGLGTDSVHVSGWALVSPVRRERRGCGDRQVTGD